uniref:MARVEL domain-containing protein n=1 Tax=Ditylenchus dipsaci TaxID=166011 RepID=A0A915DQV2_9BILA
MPEIHFHSSYLTSDRGITKIVQIVLGLVVCSILCANWYGGMSCFGEGRIGFASGLNFFTLVVNIILFLLNLFNIRLYKLEQCISVVMVILFTLAIILLIWLMIANGNWMCGSSSLPWP